MGPRWMKVSKEFMGAGRWASRPCTSRQRAAARSDRSRTSSNLSRLKGFPVAAAMASMASSIWAVMYSTAWGSSSIPYW